MKRQEQYQDLIHQQGIRLFSPTTMTIDTAGFRLTNALECYQAYVALSRTQNLDELCLVGWHPHPIKHHQVVIKYDIQIPSIIFTQ